MEDFKNQIVNIDRGKYSKEQLVSILVLVADKLEINTISEVARLEGKTPRGIKESKKYRKINIGIQLFAIKGLDENNLPFD